MAKKSRSQISAPFKWIFLLGVVVSIPVTLLAINSTPTETRSHAATTYTCSSSNTSGTCPSGQKCGYDSNLGMYTCLTALAAPTNLDGRAWYCPVNGKEYDSANFNWKAVPGAQSYTIYTRPYSSNNYTYKAWPVGNTTGKLIPTVYSGTTLNKRAIQWYVIAYRSGYVNGTSSTKVTNKPYLSCPQ